MEAAPKHHAHPSAFWLSLCLSLLLHAILIISLPELRTSNFDTPSIVANTLQLRLKLPLNLEEFPAPSTHRDLERRPPASETKPEPGAQVEGFESLPALDVLQLLKNLPAAPEESAAGGSTENGAVVLDPELLKILEQAERVTGTTDTELGLGSRSSYNGGAWMDSVVIDGRCFRILRENPLEPASRETWYRVRCKN